MLDIAWPELAVIGVVALVAIGPKDLPKVMRTLGQWAGKARSVMREFQNSIEQLNYESEIAEKMKNQPPPAAPKSQTADTDRDRPGSA